LATKRNGTFYTGVTSELIVRSAKHKEEVTGGFTKKYGVKMLVYYEIYADAETAIRREKRLKKWPRAYKMKVIEEMNPDWDDLYETITA
jgi:putative endonuclease